MIGLIKIKKRKSGSFFFSLLPVVNENNESDGDNDEDTDADDDGGEVVVNDPPRLCRGLEVPQQGGGQTAAVALLQDVLANCVRVIEVTSQFARVHNLRFIVTQPGSEKQIVQL